MKKVIRLTESDLTRVVKRVIAEQENKVIANKVEKVIEIPKVQDKLEDIVSSMSEKDIDKLKRTLDSLGIDEYSSAEEVYNKVKDVADDEISGEIDEEDESSKEKTAKILHNIGSGNLAAWGGVPAAIGIGGLLVGTVGSPFVAGLAISWGVTGLLMGLAKLLGNKD